MSESVNSVHLRRARFHKKRTHGALNGLPDDKAEPKVALAGEREHDTARIGADVTAFLISAPLRAAESRRVYSKQVALPFQNDSVSYYTRDVVPLWQ